MQDLNLLNFLRQNPRFNTGKSANLTVEQLWQLSIAELDRLAESISQELVSKQPANTMSYRKTKNTNPEIQKEMEFLKNKLEVVEQIITALQVEKEAQQTQINTRAQREQIADLIREKQNQLLRDKSVEELEEMMRNLKG